jgi:hypothetical protein
MLLLYRSVESQRLVLHNCTLVVPPVEVDNIMSWVTQLANPLPAAQRQVRIQQLLLDADYKVGLSCCCGALLGACIGRTCLPHLHWTAGGGL